MQRKWKERYSQKFRSRTVERMNSCENILRLSRELGIHRRLLYKWRDQLESTDAEVEFVYLAVVLDAFSRKVVGWSLDRTLQSRLPLNALTKAIANRRPPPGLVHHSDRGVQYACEEYIQVLRDHQMMPSMSRPGNPYDNASCESFMKTLKWEEIYANEYRDLEHLVERVEEFIEHYYNRCRLHSALGYRPPEEFEEESGQRHAEASLVASTLTFVRGR